MKLQIVFIKPMDVVHTKFTASGKALAIFSIDGHMMFP